MAQGQPEDLANRYVTSPTSRQAPCPNVSDLENELMIPWLPDKMCYVDLRTQPHYRQAAEDLTFTFNAKNKLQPTGHEQKQLVPHFAVGKKYFM